MKQCRSSSVPQSGRLFPVTPGGSIRNGPSGFGFKYVGILSLTLWSSLGLLLHAIWFLFLASMLAKPCDTIFLNLAYFTEHHDVQFHPFSWGWHNFTLLYGWIIFHCILIFFTHLPVVSTEAGSISWLLWIVLQETWVCRSPYNILTC